MFQALKEGWKRPLKRVFRPSLKLACDNVALSMLRPIEFDYLPWSAAAIRPSALCALLNEIIINQRRTIAEFGAGISTLYTARILQEVGGRLVSFEHDQGWCDLVAGYLRRFGLEDVAVVHHAPLTACDVALEGNPWYDTSVVQRGLDAVGTVDGVVVDGPPASSAGRELARFPAIPQIQDTLAESYFVYLDDIDRRGEQAIMRRWERLLGVEARVELVAGNFAMLRRGGRFATSISAGG